MQYQCYAPTDLYYPESNIVTHLSKKTKDFKHQKSKNKKAKNYEQKKTIKSSENVNNFSADLKILVENPSDNTAP